MNSPLIYKYKPTTFADFDMTPEIIEILNKANVISNDNIEYYNEIIEKLKELQESIKSLSK